MALILSPPQCVKNDWCFVLSELLIFFRVASVVLGQLHDLLQIRHMFLHLQITQQERYHSKGTAKICVKTHVAWYIL